MIFCFFVTRRFGGSPALGGCTLGFQFGCFLKGGLDFGLLSGSPPQRREPSTLCRRQPSVRLPGRRGCTGSFLGCGSRFCSFDFSLLFGLHLGNLLRRRLGFGLFREVIKLLHKFRTGENSLLEIIAETDCIRRTGGDTQLAESATAKVVDIPVEFFLFLTVPGIYHLGFHCDGAVGTVSFACTASYALMVPLGVVDELKRGAETRCNIHLVAVFGVSFSNLRGNKFLAVTSSPFMRLATPFLRMKNNLLHYPFLLLLFPCFSILETRL